MRLFYHENEDAVGNLIADELTCKQATNLSNHLNGRCRFHGTDDFYTLDTADECAAIVAEATKHDKGMLKFERGVGMTFTREEEIED